jgi:hypothetical protein
MIKLTKYQVIYLHSEINRIVGVTDREEEINSSNRRNID